MDTRAQDHPARQPGRDPIALDHPVRPHALSIRVRAHPVPHPVLYVLYVRAREIEV
jgi:hypothetical protein